MSPVITFTKVRLPYGWLGNMSPHPVVIDGTRWKTGEHAFQALRFGAENPIRESIRRMKSPMDVKMRVKLARHEFVIEPTSEDDLVLMRRVVRAKLNTNPELRPELDGTAGCTLIEDVTNRPHGNALFWGAAREPDGSWTGQNWLGRIWMELRDGE